VVRSQSSVKTRPFSLLLTPGHRQLRFRWIPTQESGRRECILGGRRQETVGSLGSQSAVGSADQDRNGPIFERLACLPPASRVREATPDCLQLKRESDERLAPDTTQPAGPPS
jgi:hypothetical protein